MRNLTPVVDGQQTPVNALRRAAQIAGSRAELGRLIGASGARILNWERRDLKVPPEFAPLIEKGTGVRCEELCPSFPWAVFAELRLGRSRKPRLSAVSG